MARYVDGFVVPVPEDKLDAYLEMARSGEGLARAGCDRVPRVHRRRREDGRGDVLPA